MSKKKIKTNGGGKSLEKRHREDADDNMVSMTATFRPMNQAELHDAICLEMIEYARRSWWQKKRYLLRNAIDYAIQYNAISDAITSKKSL